VSFKIIFHPKAEKELLKSIEWYEEISEGLGDDFLNETIDIIENLEKFPLMYAIKKKNFREAVLKKFPYVIVYTITQKVKEVHILSIFQTSQQPKKKYKK
jgi:mRNA-degrading endonuclease RelE of RelBE toxin-antitoxin system